MKNKILIIIAFSISLIIILVVALQSKQEKEESKEISSNVTVDQEKQVIHIISKAGGYSPKTVYAKAGVQTVLEIESKNSYGCERAFRIPSFSISQELPTDGKTTFDLGKPSKNITGTCGMGMYTFKINFI